MKVLYFIRHGTALHNVLFWEQGEKVYLKYRDTPLVKKGVEEAKNLGETWEDIQTVLTTELYDPDGELSDYIIQVEDKGLLEKILNKY